MCLFKTKQKKESHFFDIMTEAELQKTTQMTNQNDDDDDVPFLSADTFKALQEFYTEKEAVEKSMDENWVKKYKT